MVNKLFGVNADKLKIFFSFPFLYVEDRFIINIFVVVYIKHDVFSFVDAIKLSLFFIIVE